MKRRRSAQKRRTRRRWLIFLLILLALLLFWPRRISLEGLISPEAVLMDADSGEVLAAKNADASIYPASMTKVMTALLVLEANPDLDTPVTLPEDIFPELRAEGASMAGFLPGETATVRDLLYGALLPSGAECCEALAREVSGSEEAFVASKRPQRWGWHPPTSATPPVCMTRSMFPPRGIWLFCCGRRCRMRCSVRSSQQPATPCRPRICTRTALRWRARFGANWTARSCAGENFWAAKRAIPAPPGSALPARRK